MPVMDIVEEEGSTSWVGFSGALVAAAVAGVAIGRAGTTARATSSDELDEDLVKLDTDS